MTATQPRDVPALASDIRRSWIVVATAIPVMAGIPFLLLLPAIELDLSYDTFLRVAFYSGWTVFSILYLGLTARAFWRAEPGELVAWLRATRPPEEPGKRFWWSLNGGGAIWWSITGAAVTLYTLVTLAISAEAAHPLVVATGIAVVVASASLIVVSFAVHYARLDATDGGFAFPGEGRPGFRDYLYLAIQVGTTFGGSDVELTGTRARMAVSLHSVIASTFTTVLVGLLVSVLLRAVQPGA